jgi:hypothetical protein
MARGIKEAIYIRTLNPDLNAGRGRYALPLTYDTIINTTIQPPKSPPPSAPGSPPPTFDINRQKPKGCQPGAKNIIKCFPLVDAAIASAAAATPTGVPQAPKPTPTVARRPGRPRRNTTADTAGSATTTAAAPTVPQPPPNHVMTTRARAFHTSSRDALTPPPATGVSKPF